MAAIGSAEKLKVFISYSRRDSNEFAEELAAGLELVGFAPFLDRHDIAAGEDWEARLGGLIQEADTVVFIISHEAVKSERCSWEVDRAVEMSKRLIPVVWKTVSDSAISERLRRRQFVRFDTGFGITRPLAQLADALRQDIDWIREHTRLGELVQRWEARGRPESLLLRGDDLIAAQAWVAKRKADAPEITGLMQTFFAASRTAEAAFLAKSGATQRRIIRLQKILSVLLIAVIIGLVVWINQSYLKAQWRWYMVTRPYMLANVRPHVLTAAAEKALKPGDSFKECSADCPKMIVVPAGSFTMGSPTSEKDRTPYEGPQHIVTIRRPFAVSKYELTFAEWDACAAFGDCDGHIDDNGFGRGRQPVINVTWYDAKQYVTWLSRMTGKDYRLLSEAEYEYAARAGTQTIFPWGDEIGKNNADCVGCGSQWDNKQSAPVGSFASNQFGLYDMVGNVWQWVEDCWHETYDDAPADGSAWITGGNCNFRVDRAAGWTSLPEIPRSALRDKDGIGTKDDIIGFRVGRTLD